MMRKFILSFISLCPLLGYANSPCSKEGEMWQTGTGRGEGVSCCKDLTPASLWVTMMIKDEKSFKCSQIKNGPESEKGYCVKCGDGKCDSIHAENKCDCPKDCK